MREKHNSTQGQALSAETALGIEQSLKSVLSPRQPLQPLQPILVSVGALTKQQQQFVVHWVGVIASSNIELAYHFAALCGKAFKELDQERVNRWIGQALKLYDVEGLYPAIRFLKDVEGFKVATEQINNAVELEEMIGVLTLYIHGLAGRELNIKSGKITYTDTTTLYLPERLAVYPSKEKNRQLYKAMACFLWAQTWFGTFKKKNYSAISLQDRLKQYTQADFNTIQKVFLVLENIRLMSCIQRELPGLYREMNRLNNHSDSNGVDKDNTWLKYPYSPYLGELELREVEISLLERQQQAGMSLLDQMKKGFLNKNSLEDALKEFTAKQATDQQAGLSSEQESELTELLSSMSQDVEMLEPDWIEQLKQAVETTERATMSTKADKPSPQKLQPVLSEHYYDEWDYERQQYRESWCRLIEKEVFTSVGDFEQETLYKHRHLIARIRKVFSVINDQSTLLKNQVDGEDITDRFYMRKNHNNRSFAVLLLIDLSGSTKGWINQLERESLLLIVEGLEILGDQYAIFGFSGLTRQRCEIYQVKRFSEHNKPLTQSKISALSAKDYTRMGVAIRHSTEQLKNPRSPKPRYSLLCDYD